MKRVLAMIMLSLMMGSIFGIQVWQHKNKWLDLNFISESEFGHSFIVERDYSNQFLTDNSMALDVAHMNFKVGVADYRTRHFFQPLSGVDSLDYYVDNVNQAVYTDISIYMQPRFKVIFSMKLTSINQPAPYYSRLSTPVGKISVVRQYVWYHSLISMEGSYSTNMQTNESINPNKANNAKYVGDANHLEDNMLFFDAPDVFDASKHHFKGAFSYYTNVKRGFSPLPDKTPLIYTPNGTFVFKTVYDYYIDGKRGEIGQGEQLHLQKLSVDANYRFWRVFELYAHAKAVDEMIDKTWIDYSDIDMSASLRSYLYDFDEAKLIPAITFRHIESVNNAQDQLMRLDRMLTFSGYASLKLNKNVLLTGLVSDDLILNWYRNDAYPQALRIDYGKHIHIISAAVGLTVWY